MIGKSKSLTSAEQPSTGSSKEPIIEVLKSPSKPVKSSQGGEKKLEKIITKQRSTEISDYTSTPEKVQSQLSKDLAKSDTSKDFTNPDVNLETTKSASNVDIKDLKTDVGSISARGKSDSIGVSIPGKKSDQEQSHSVPSIYELPHFIESLGGTAEGMAVITLQLNRGVNVALESSRGKVH